MKIVNGLNERLIWHNTSQVEVLRSVGSGQTGLSSGEAQKRLDQSQPNVIKSSTRQSRWMIFADQFKTVMVWGLLSAAVISVALGEYGDSLAIFIIVLLNCIIGFYQEWKAEESVEALRNFISPHCRVRRGNQVQELNSKDVVLGDILLLEAGDIVAADGRLLISTQLECNEAALTGESSPTLKSAATLNAKALPIGDRANMVFMGSSVSRGIAEAVVVSTAMATELGQIATILQTHSAVKETPLQKKLNEVGHILLWAALGIVILLFAIGLARGDEFRTLLMTSIGLAIAAIPEGLPAIVTGALSVGVLRIGRRGALVRKLSSVETLGSTAVICTDKTGTLTEGKMAVQEFFVANRHYQVTGEGYEEIGDVRCGNKLVIADDEPDLIALVSSLIGSNKAILRQTKLKKWEVLGDPTEGALLVAGKKVGLLREELDKSSPIAFELPFDSTRKRSATVRQTTDGKLLVQVNGAPGPLLEFCTRYYSSEGAIPLQAEDRVKLAAEIDRMAAAGLRVLGSANRSIQDSNLSRDSSVIEQDLSFIGLVGMQDSPRKEARRAIEKCANAGVRVVMITGDHALTATVVAKELGLGHVRPAMTGEELDTLSDSDFAKIAGDISIYARVSAAHKLRIVRGLKVNGDVVAMTGDGVNDAPALQGADIGIAMGVTGSEVTKQVADIILTDDNFSTIVAAIEEGRAIYANIRKTLQYLLAGNTGEILLILVCVLCGLPMPLLPIHLLWINLVTDGLPALCLALDPIDDDLMRDKPRPKEANMMDSNFFQHMVISGLLIAAVTLAVFLFALKHFDLDQARSYAFTVLIFAELLRAFGIRSETRPIWKISLGSNMKLVYVCSGAFIFQLWSQHEPMLYKFLQTVPIRFPDFCILILIAAVPLLILEALKLAKLRRADTFKQ